MSSFLYLPADRCEIKFNDSRNICTDVSRLKHHALWCVQKGGGLFDLDFGSRWQEEKTLKEDSLAGLQTQSLLNWLCFNSNPCFLVLANEFENPNLV